MNNSKPNDQDHLAPFRVVHDGERLTTDQGVRIRHTDDTLTAGERGPSLLEDFHFREKMTRFDHERIPERVVHARGTGVHGFFQAYESQAAITKAGFLQDPSKQTPVFVRFSTVVGSRGSADTVRDARGFAVKFYTDEGNFDLVSNNIPVFFIQDGIKFPDVVHSIKPEPHNEIPQATAAHDTFWDFVSLVPETAHMIMWLMSDRAIPRSYQMMEGFGVHTFRLINAQGQSKLVKFHWKPVLGVHALAWDEAQKIAGKDPDYHRRDLWDAIEAGNFPEWELGLQIVDEDAFLDYGFDLLDATKFLPEEMVPVVPVGKMTLNRNPRNFFAETEQVAFHVGNVVPGIDFTDDPLMQARLFSYLDTQLLRLGGPNFSQLPINRPIAAVHNHQQDGFSQQLVPEMQANYHPNSVDGGCPFLSAVEEGGFEHFPAEVTGPKMRKRSETFVDHFRQATMFLNSMSVPERAHIVEALQFEVGKVVRPEIRARVVNEILHPIDPKLAEEVAPALGVQVTGPSSPPEKNAKLPKTSANLPASSPAVSMADSPGSPMGRKVAILVADGFDGEAVSSLMSTLEGAGAMGEVVAPVLGPIGAMSGAGVEAKKTFITTSSVLYDAVFVPGGAQSVEALAEMEVAGEFVRDAYRHCKPIGATGEGRMLLEGAHLGENPVDRPGAVVDGPEEGVFVQDSWTSDFGDTFLSGVPMRFWARQFPGEVSASGTKRKAMA